MNQDANLRWCVLRTRPVRRIEFSVLHELTKMGHAAMLPFVVDHERRPGKRHPVERKQALFPSYVFVGLEDVERDYARIRAELPDVAGIVSRRRGVWSPHILRIRDVALISSLVRRAMGGRSRRGLTIGQPVDVDIGGVAQRTKVDAMSKKGITALLQILDGMHVVEDIPFPLVRAVA